MNFLKKIFGSKKEFDNTPEGFWAWFEANSKVFTNSFDNAETVDSKFIKPLVSRLNRIREGFIPIVNYAKSGEIEIVFSVHGELKNVCFAETLVEIAPKLEGWKFTALKPALADTDYKLVLNGIEYSENNLFFYPIEDENFPEEIRITFVHKDFRKEWIHLIIPGLLTFLQHYIGEKYCITAFDLFDVVEKKDAIEELIPLNKFKDFIEWRKSELDEKLHNSEYHGISSDLLPLEGTLPNGQPIQALVNAEVQKWGAKMSYPYVLVVTFKYSGDSNGLPRNEDAILMDQYELKLSMALKDTTRYLKFGRQTANNTRNIIFLSKNYIELSRIADELRYEYRFSVKSL